MAVVVFLTLVLEGVGCGGVGGEGEVFVEEGLHVCCGFGGCFVAEGTGF